MITLKRALALVGLIFLIGAAPHQKQLPAAANKSHLTVPELTYASITLPHLTTNRDFLDDINLSFDPPGKIHAPDLNDAGLNFQRDLPPGSFGELQPKLGDTSKRALTVADRKLNYELLGSRDIAFKLNLTPAYPRPEATMPTSLDPGFGFSIKF